MSGFTCSVGEEIKSFGERPYFTGREDGAVQLNPRLN